jgi:acetyl esterase/lipase
MRIQTLVLVIIFMFLHRGVDAQQLNATKKENVVYGMVSGAALLMDVYTPPRPNHKAIIYIVGSAWGFVYPLHYNQTPLKDDVFLDSTYTGQWVASLLQNGYTVFVINHRFTPKFQYQDIIEDCRRAVRFVRYNAKDYQIDPMHIGAMGHSSGGNLASLLGVSDNTKITSRSPIDSVSAKVQAVVTLAAPFSVVSINRPEDTTIDNNFVVSVIAAYMGSLPEMKSGNFVMSGKFVDASPIAQVTKDDAPTYICYSDNDPVIAVRQATEMYDALLRQNVPAKITVSHHTFHSPIPDMVEVCRWFEKYLK